MPIVECSGYRPPPGFANGHVQTIFPALFRRVPPVTAERERLTLDDGDFLDLDWSRTPNTDRIAILTHGLEGDSKNSCIQGMAMALRRAGWDVLAWNFRGCSGEPNLALRSYHSGATEDLQAVVSRALEIPEYQRISFVGFSLGGNMLLKYLGDLAGDVDPRIHRAVAFSVPCDLASSSRQLEEMTNRLYMQRFLRTLREKIRDKIRRFPGSVHDVGLDRMRTFKEFDGAYTAPMHGFSSAEDYWERASCKPVLAAISVPTLLVNAKNDPFLPEECFPVEAARANPNFFFESPASGGHAGFVSFDPSGQYWSETRVVEFLG